MRFLAKITLHSLNFAYGLKEITAVKTLKMLIPNLKYCFLIKTFKNLKLNNYY
jgi:hypothetical protein